MRKFYQHFFGMPSEKSPARFPWTVLLDLAQRVRDRAVKDAYELGRWKVDEFTRMHPFVLEKATNKNLMIGFYITRDGQVDYNFYFFKDSGYAEDWAAAPSRLGSRHALVQAPSSVARGRRLREEIRGERLVAVDRGN